MTHTAEPWHVFERHLSDGSPVYHLRLHLEGARYARGAWIDCISEDAAYSARDLLNRAHRVAAGLEHMPAIAALRAERDELRAAMTTIEAQLLATLDAAADEGRANEIRRGPIEAQMLRARAALAKAGA